MLIRETQFKTCRTCGDRKRTQDEVYGCDVCRKAIDLSKPHAAYHEVTMFWHGSGDRTTRHQFCSVRCFVQWMKEQPMGSDVDFMSFPLFHAPQLREFQTFLTDDAKKPRRPAR